MLLLAKIHDIKPEPLHQNISHPGVKKRYSTIRPGGGKFFCCHDAILCRSRVADFRLVLLLAIASMYARVCLCLPWFYLVYLHKLMHSRRTINPTEATIAVVLDRRWRPLVLRGFGSLSGDDYVLFVFFSRFNRMIPIVHLFDVFA